MLMTERAAHHVRLYYDRVDSGDIVGLLDLFAPEAVYHRPGYLPMVGREELERFYDGERVIESGCHTLQRVTADDASVAVHGEFVGVLKDGSHATARFADFFVVGRDGRFTRRDTFFFVPTV